MLNLELASWHEINRDKETTCWNVVTTRIKAFCYAE